MLILTRKLGETICLYPEGYEEDVEKITFIKIVDVNFNQIRIGVKAPDNIVIHRAEIHRKILDNKQLELKF